MRIVIDYRPALRQRSGVGQWTHQMVEALAAGPGRRDEIVLFSSSLRHQVDPTLLDGLRVTNRRVPVRVLNRMWHRLGWPPVEMLVRGPFDVAHSPHPLLLPSRSGAQLVTIHDLDFLSHPERTEGEVRRDYPGLVREHVLAADHVIAVSAYTAGEVEERLGVPRHAITVCRAGAPNWTPRPAVPESGPIVFVGTLEPRKNVSALLDAYQLLLTSGGPSPPELLLIGRQTAAAAPWLARLANAPLAGHARYLGYVTDEQRRALYERARLLVLPSFEEGFGLPVLEAMTVGVPVVASARGAIPEVLGDAGELVEPDDVVGLARAIERLLWDHRAAGAAAARGLRRSHLFRWDSAAEALRQAYEAAMVQRRARVGPRAPAPQSA